MHYLTALVFCFIFNALFCGGCAPASPVQAQPTEYGGRCMGIRPLCGPGLHPECICYDAFGNNCTWQCVR